MVWFEKSRDRGELVELTAPGLRALKISENIWKWWMNKPCRGHFSWGLWWLFATGLDQIRWKMMSPRFCKWLFLGHSSFEQADTAKKRFQKSCPEFKPSICWSSGKGWQSKGQAEAKVQVAAMGDMPNGNQGNACCGDKVWSWGEDLGVRAVPTFQNPSDQIRYENMIGGLISGIYRKPWFLPWSIGSSCKLPSHGRWGWRDPPAHFLDPFCEKHARETLGREQGIILSNWKPGGNVKRPLTGTADENNRSDKLKIRIYLSKGYDIAIYQYSSNHTRTTVLLVLWDVVRIRLQRGNYSFEPRLKSRGIINFVPVRWRQDLRVCVSTLVPNCEHPTGPTARSRGCFTHGSQ